MINRNQIELKIIQDDRGKLIALEALKNVPFEIKRVYFLYDLNEEKARGFHAHKELEQMMLCLNGSCSVVLDDGKSKSLHLLSAPSKALFINKMIWHEMRDFSKDCILIVLANDFYDESDYIRNYEEFLTRCSQSSIDD